MCDDRTHPLDREFVESVPNVLRNHELRKLNQQIASAVDRVFRWVLERILNILVRQMEVAAQAQLQAVAHVLPNRLDPLPVLFRIELIRMIRVRRAHNVRDPVRSGQFRLLHGPIEVPGPVVNSEQQMMVDIDHAFWLRVPTNDSKILNPSEDPSSASLERSGCGIIPSTFRLSLRMPAMFSSDPFGFASAVISPSAVEYRKAMRS